MVAALLLVALLFRLGIEGRAEEIGVLRTVGMRNRKIFAVLAVEALVVTAVGSLLGVAAGVGYAWLMIVGLTTWWVSAISTPFLHLYVTPQSLLIGFFGGLIVSLLTVLWTLRRLGRISVRRLLAGQAAEDRFRAQTKSSRGTLDCRRVVRPGVDVRRHGPLAQRRSAGRGVRRFRGAGAGGGTGLDLELDAAAGHGQPRGHRLAADRAAGGSQRGSQPQPQHAVDRVDRGGELL